MTEIHEILKAFDMRGDEVLWLVDALMDASVEMQDMYIDPEYAERQAKVVSALAHLGCAVEREAQAAGRI